MKAKAGRAFASLVMLVLLCSGALAERFPPDARVINVTDPYYGALPNDGVDDTAAIQRVFNMITPSARVVYFPNGTYDFSDEIVLQKTDFAAEAESLSFNGWQSVTEGTRTFLRAVQTGANPDAAGRITFRFDAIEARRALRLTHRISAANVNSFFWRINGGTWNTNARPFGGNTGWRDYSVVATDIPLQTGANTLEIAVRDVGFEIDSIALGYLGSYLNNTIVEGESKAGTIFKLRDNLQVNGMPFNGALLRWESGVEQFFRTAVRDITFDVGSANPQADGLKFHGNNQSTVANVSFRAANGSGDVALDLAHTAAIGPILVRDIDVDGFAVGIHCAWQNASRTFERIRLRNQRTFGWVNEAASTVWIRGFVSENSVTAFQNDTWRLPGDGQGRVVLIDAQINGLSGANTRTAIDTLGNFYARNVRVSGYQSAINNQNQAAFRAYRGQDGIDGDRVTEWWSTGAFDGEGGGMSQLFDSVDTMLGLPIEETPQTPIEPFSAWDGPHRHPIEIQPGVFSGTANDNVDDTASLQAAIDSGASTIYLPNGRWVIDGTVQMRGNVRRLLGTEAEMSASGSTNAGQIVIANGAGDTVWIERLANFGFGGRNPVFIHNSGRTVVFSSVTGMDYRANMGAGKVFLNDTVGAAIRFVVGQKVWARQLNIEENTTLAGASFDARLVNDGADVWVLGFKTEQAGVIAKTVNGGRTELFGNLQLNDFGSTTPQYVVNDSAFTAVVNIKPYPEPGTSYGRISETRASVTRTGSFSGTGFSAFGESALWQLRREVIMDNSDPRVQFSGVWSASNGFPRGFVGNNFQFAASGAANVARFPVTLPEAGIYEVYVRWVADWGGQDHSNHASQALIEVQSSPSSVTNVRVDQRVSSDGWYRLGAFPMTAGLAERVRVSGDGANGKVNIDAIRLVQLPERMFANGFE
jgi:hypothetical protein